MLPLVCLQKSEVFDVFSSDVKQIEPIHSRQQGLQPEMDLYLNTHSSPD